MIRAITISVSDNKQSIITALDKLADSLGASRGHLIWHAIEHIVAHPPKEIKITKTVKSGVGVGSAPGFWVIYDLNDDYSLKATRIQEVKISSDHVKKGADMFYRYKKGDAKGRKRSLEAAKIAADHTSRMAKKRSILVIELIGADLQDVLTPEPKTDVKNP